MYLNPKRTTRPSWILGIATLSIVSFALSCSEPMTPQLSRDMKKTLDSIFKSQIIELDSLSSVSCDKVYPAIFKRAKDSLYDLRVEEIRSILDQ